MELAIALGFVEKSGSWFSYNGVKIAQGKENAIKYFETHPEEMAELEQKIRTTIANGEASVEEDIDLDTDDFDIDDLLD